MDPDRLNSPSTFSMNLEILGHELQFSQDPNSKHLGTTVWDASLVFVKFLEKNSRKGKFCPSKLKGKRVIELGAGCGVAGFGMALLGCDVVATDQVEVLPLLMRNVERNTSRILQMNPGSDSFGSVQVAELDWGNKDHIMAVGPPFDYIIGTDVVYAEHLLDPLLQTISALSGPKTTLLLGYEIRSTSVHEQMLQMWRRNFNVKTVPQSKMDETFQHPSIQIFIMGLKPPVKKLDKSEVSTMGENEKVADSVGDEGSEDCELLTNLKTEKIDKSEVSTVDENEKAADSVDDEINDDCELLTKVQNENLGDFEVRRYGSMAARLLRDVKIA